MKKDIDRKTIILSLLKEQEIKGLADQAIELANALNWTLPKTCDQVAAETVSSISWFLPNYEDYGFLYCTTLSEIIEEKARAIIQNDRVIFEIN